MDMEIEVQRLLESATAFTNTHQMTSKCCSNENSYRSSQSLQIFAPFQHISVTKEHSWHKVQFEEMLYNCKY